LKYISTAIKMPHSKLSKRQVELRTITQQHHNIITMVKLEMVHISKLSDSELNM